MKRQFTIPVMFALLFHAVLLLGSHRGPSVTSASDNDKTDRDLPPIPMILEDVPVLELVDAEKDTSQKLGNTDETARMTPEPPAKPVPSVFPMDAIPVPAVSKVVVDKIPTGVLGVPMGAPEGIYSESAVFDVTKLDKPPRATVQIAPIYPAEAKMRGYSGEVVVAFIVNEAGRVLSPHVVSSTDPLFNDAALRAVAKWRFEPGRHLGRSVSFRMAVPIVFTMN